MFKRTLTQWLSANNRESIKYTSPIVTTLGNQKCPYNTIYVNIDTSGSTFNLHSRGSNGNGGGGRFQQLAPLDTSATKTEQPITKIIILAEVDGVAIFLTELCAKYNLVGVRLVLKSFGTEIYTEIDEVIENSERFIHIINNLPDFIICDANLTSTLACLKEEFDNDICESALLILATDGHPNNSGNCNDVLNYMSELSKKDKRIDIIAIGAGSIQEQTGSSMELYTRSYGSRGKDTLNIALSSHTECNMNFLMNFKKFATIAGVYLPACTDYSELKEGISRFLNLKVNYGTVIGNEIIYYSYPDRISDTLENDLCYYIKQPFGEYILIRQNNGTILQLRLEPGILVDDKKITNQKQLEFINENNYTVGFVDNEKFMFFEENNFSVQQVELFKQDNMYVYTINNNGVTSIYRHCLYPDGKGWPCVRLVIKN